MNTIRPIRLKRPWRGHAPGYVYTDMSSAASQVLVERGFAEYADEQVQRAPVDRMMRSRATRQRAQA